MSQQRNQRRNLKYLETNEDGNTIFQNLWDTAKAILKGKFTTVQGYLKKQEKSK